MVFARLVNTSRADHAESRERRRLSSEEVDLKRSRRPFDRGLQAWFGAGGWLRAVFRERYSERPHTRTHTGETWRCTTAPTCYSHGGCAALPDTRSGQAHLAGGSTRSMGMGAISPNARWPPAGMAACDRALQGGLKGLAEACGGCSCAPTRVSRVAAASHGRRQMARTGETAGSGSPCRHPDRWKRKV